MDDAPVSWLAIRPGWKVVAADGTQVGRVDEVAGDDTKDIFDGLAVAASALGRPRYVLGEQVGRITEGTVHLRVSPAEFSAEEEYREPASSERIEADNRTRAGGGLAAEARELAQKAVRPVQRHEHRLNVWRRAYLWLQRTVGRR